MFESRNPNLDWYEIWGTENLWTTEQGEVRWVRSSFLSDGEYVNFRHPFEFNDETLVSDSRLRFASQQRIRHILEEVGFDVATFFGDWQSKEFEAGDREMTFVAIKP